MKWKRSNTNDQIDSENLSDYLMNLFDEEMDKGHTLKVAIGTDSQRSGKRYKFATVILITTYQDLGGGVIVGRGGIIISTIYYMDLKSKGKEGVNERMLIEVSKSIEHAYELASLMDLYEIKLEIHADINPNPKWESNKALSQAIGYILGMGYEFRIKPSAPASSNAADRLCG